MNNETIYITITEGSDCLFHLIAPKAYEQLSLYKIRRESLYEAMAVIAENANNKLGKAVLFELD